MSEPERHGTAEGARPNLRPAAFPAEYLDSFIHALTDPRRNIVVITYGDLRFGSDFQYEKNYPAEWRAWNERIAAGALDPTKIYVCLHHDVDAAPELTHRLLEVQSDLGVRSNVMIFNRLVNRRKLNLEGVAEESHYPIDRALLRRLEQAGWVVGYHSNAYERAAFDRDRAGEIFTRDVEELRELFDIRFFCPHGGVRDAEGYSNASLELPENMRREVRWTLNRYTVRFHGIFSDGGLGGRKKGPDTLDIRKFMARWRPGRRYRLLIHPQYYGPEYRRPKKLEGVPWYHEICDRAVSGRGFSDWWPPVRSS